MLVKGSQVVIIGTNKLVPTLLVKTLQLIWKSAGLILGLHPANERRRYKVTPSLIGWVQN